MQTQTILKTLGLLLMLFSLSMLAPLLVNNLYHEGHWLPFLIAFNATAASGFCVWLPFRHQRVRLKVRDGFVLVVLFWTVLSVFGSLPFLLAPQPHAKFIDALFESVSGLTTTGASVLSGLAHFPHAILFYRQELQFLGGMGIIVLALAILPMLGIGGLQLYQAEMPGPMKDKKLTPRITETAKALWIIYVGLTLLCAISYYLAGMPLFDAIGESLSTIATGGFTLHDESFAFYHSDLINMIAAFFMMLGGCNFALHFSALSKRQIKPYWQDEEFRTYIGLLFFMVLFATFILTTHHFYNHHGHALLEGFFAVTSLLTTTGFTAGAFSVWPSHLPYLLMMLGLIGGCAASTSGGIKVIRLLLLHKQGSREIKRLVHPHAVISLKLGQRILDHRIIHAVWGFFAIFLIVFIVLFIALMSTGLDAHTALCTVAAMITNVGAGIGPVAHGYADLNTTAKLIAIFTMLAGRLEIFTLLVLFTPAFWKH